MTVSRAITKSANWYQAMAKETAIFPEHKAMEYLALGLVGESGEIANKVKKLIRDGADKETLEQKRIDIAYEIGDVLWYCAMLADEMGVELGDIMDANLKKLYSRKERGTLQGEGDNR